MENMLVIAQGITNTGAKTGRSSPFTVDTSLT